MTRVARQESSTGVDFIRHALRKGLRACHPTPGHSVGAPRSCVLKPSRRIARLVPLARAASRTRSMVESSRAKLHAVISTTASIASFTRTPPNYVRFIGTSSHRAAVNARARQRASPRSPHARRQKASQIRTPRAHRLHIPKSPNQATIATNNLRIIPRYR